MASKIETKKLKPRKSASEIFRPLYISTLYTLTNVYHGLSTNKKFATLQPLIKKRAQIVLIYVFKHLLSRKSSLSVLLSCLA